MKKNLRNLLILSLGLITTGAFAQDWNGDSRTRIDMSGDHDATSTDQRATLGVTWGDSDWGIHVSTVANYTLGKTKNDLGKTVDQDITFGVYEAYGSASLFGFANMTVGRQALEYGSGNLIGKNDWAADRNTWDGMTFTVNNDLADLTIGYAKQNSPMEDADTVMQENSGTQLFLNMAKAGDNWNVNLFYMDDKLVTMGQDSGTSNGMGLDLGYSMSGFDIGVSYNTATKRGGDEMDMMTLSAGYAVNDNLSLSASRTAYGDHGFSSPWKSNTSGVDASTMDSTETLDALGAGTGEYTHQMTSGSSQGNWMDNGNMGHLRAEDVAMSLGVDYSMGAINVNASWTTVSSGAEDDGTTRDGKAWDEWERTVMDFGLGYNLNDNAALSLRYVTDAVADNDADKYMWVGLQITP